MAGLNTYADLQAAIASYTDGSSASFDPQTLIALAEADFRRLIVATEQEGAVTLDLGNISLPNDVDSIRSLSIAAYPNVVLQQVSPSQFYSLPASVAGKPSCFIVSAGSLLLWPSPDQPYAATLIYRRTIPALSDTNTTNWLLAEHPDAYLFGSILQAEFYGWFDERLPLLQQKLSSIINDINSAQSRKRYGGGPLIMRPDTADWGGGIGTSGSFLTDDGVYLVDG